jgi:hypothetical protein
MIITYFDPSKNETHAPAKPPPNKQEDRTTISNTPGDSSRPLIKFIPKKPAIATDKTIVR